MAEKSSKRVPPLAYVVVALLALIAAWIVTHWQGTYRPPSGGPPVGQTQAAGGDVAPPQAPYVPGPTAPPAPNGSGPNNLPGVQTGPPPSNRPS